MSQDTGLILMFALIAVIVIVDYLSDQDKPAPGDADHAPLTAKDPRCAALAKAQEAARERMKELGHKTLLEGKEGWQTIRPMAEAKPEMADNVIRIGRRK